MAVSSFTGGPIFSNVTAHSIEEFIGMEPGVIADVAFAKTTRKVKDREFPCVKVSFTIHGDDGEWVKEELFVSKEIKGTGLVAWKINFMDWLFVDLDLAGFGSKEKVEWGDKLDTTRTAVSADAGTASAWATGPTRSERSMNRAKILCVIGFSKRRSST